MSSNANDAFDNLMNEFTGADDPVQEPEASSEAETEETDPVEDQEEPEDTLAPEDEEAPEEEQETSEDEDPEEEEEPAPKPKGKKSAEERIREVVSKQRQAERERDAERAEKEELRRRIEQLEAAKETPAKPEAQTPAGKEFGLVEPDPDALNEDGTPKYLLGSMDPAYMRDINRYDRAVERAYEKQVAEEQAKLNKQQAEEMQLFEEWNGKLTEAEKTSPKIREKAQNLVDTFSDAEPQHMQTIAQTIMQLDNGPSVLEYLADNIDEADRIVKMPTNKALLQLGRLDGLFVPEEADDTPAPVKPTKAPPPPAKLSRGSGAHKGGQNSLYDKMLRDFR